MRTWALRGQTPVLREIFKWDKLSVIAGLTLWQFYLRIYAGGINGERAAEFPHALLRHLPGKLLLRDVVISHPVMRIRKEGCLGAQNEMSRYPRPAKPGEGAAAGLHDGSDQDFPTRQPCGRSHRQR